MNNLDTQTVKGIVGEKFYFFKATEDFLYKNGKRTEESGRNQSNVTEAKDPARYYS